MGPYYTHCMSNIILLNNWHCAIGIIHVPAELWIMAVSMKSRIQIMNSSHLAIQFNKLFIRMHRHRHRHTNAYGIVGRFKVLSMLELSLLRKSELSIHQLKQCESDVISILYGRAPPARPFPCLCLCWCYHWMATLEHQKLCILIVC